MLRGDAQDVAARHDVCEHFFFVFFVGERIRAGGGERSYDCAELVERAASDARELSHGKGRDVRLRFVRGDFEDAVRFRAHRSESRDESVGPDPDGRDATGFAPHALAYEFSQLRRGFFFRNVSRRASRGDERRDVDVRLVHAHAHDVRREVVQDPVHLQRHGGVLLELVRHHHQVRAPPERVRHAAARAAAEGARLVVAAGEFTRALGAGRPRDRDRQTGELGSAQRRDRGEETVHVHVHHDARIAAFRLGERRRRRQILQESLVPVLPRADVVQARRAKKRVHEPVRVIARRALFHVQQRFRRARSLRHASRRVGRGETRLSHRTMGISSSLPRRCRARCIVPGHRADEPRAEVRVTRPLPRGELRAASSDPDASCSVTASLALLSVVRERNETTKDFPRSEEARTSRTRVPFRRMHRTIAIPTQHFSHEPPRKILL